MHIDQRKEQFSRAYVHAVASVAGFSLASPAVDEDSVDVIFCSRGKGGTLRAPRLEAQLKCSSTEIMRETHVAFPLKRKNYDELRPTNFVVPRILIVLVVPSAPEDWLSQGEEALAMRRCAYWLSLHGFEESANEHTVTVQVPRTGLFSPMALQQMMARIGNGELP